MKYLIANKHVAGQHEIEAAWVLSFVALVFPFFFFFYSCWKLLSTFYTRTYIFRVRRKEISISYYVLLHHNLMVTWDVLIDTWYFALLAPQRIAIHSDEYHLPSLITRYVRINRFSTIPSLRIARNTGAKHTERSRFLFVISGRLPCFMIRRFEKYKASRAKNWSSIFRFRDGKKNVHPGLFVHMHSTKKRENYNLHRADN